MISTNIANLQGALLFKRLVYNSMDIRSGEMNTPLMSYPEESFYREQESSGYNFNTPSSASIHSAISYRKDPATKLESWSDQVEEITPYVPSGKGMSFTMENFLQAGKEKYTKATMRPQHYQNAVGLVNKINKLGELIDYHNVISSGYRSPERQRQIYAEKGEPPAMGSKHIYGHALDIYDPQGELKKKLLNRAVLEKAKELELYFENFGKTPTWVHIQDEAPARCGGQIWSADNLLEKNNL